MGVSRSINGVHLLSWYVDEGLPDKHKLRIHCFGVGVGNNGSDFYLNIFVFGTGIKTKGMDLFLIIGVGFGVGSI